MRRVLALGLLVLLTVQLPPPAKAAADWTFMAYMSADNDLEAAGVDDFEEMALVGGTAAVNVVVQFDRSDLNGPADGGTRAYGNWEDTRRFLVTQGMTPDPGNEQSVLGEVNMGDPAALVDFVLWATSQFPAEHYFLDLWDHGLGWEGIMVDRTSGDYLTTAELRLALDEITLLLGRRIDIVGNDACRMTVEIMYELRAYVDLFIGSEKDTPLEGWPYDRFLQRLTAAPGASPSEIAMALADEYYASYAGLPVGYSVTLSVVSSAALPPVAEALGALADELISYLPFFTAEIHTARDRTEHYEYNQVCCGDDYDLFHFTENLDAAVGGPRLARRTADLRTAIGDAVVYERHYDHPNAVNNVPAKNAHGLSIYFPQTFPGFVYQNLLMADNTSWDEMLSAFGGGPRITRGLTATAVSADTDSDGLQDRIELAATPAVNGTLSFAVEGPDFLQIRDLPAVSGQSTTDVFLPASAGAYETAIYLFEGGKLRNLVAPADVVIEADRRFLGEVTLNGTGAVGTATLRNLRTSQEIRQVLVTGDFTFRVTYPTWITDGDELLLTIETGGRVLSYTLVPDLRQENHTMRIVVPPATGYLRGFESTSFLFGIGLGGLIGALAALGIPFLLRSWRLRKLR